MLNLILFGAPGSGKGTQSERLLKKYGLVHISTGDVFRYNIKNGTELGMKAKEYMNAGKLVPDEITIGMLENEFIKNKDAKGIIFDGFPRTVPQAEALDSLMEKQNSAITGMIALEVNQAELVKRLLERGKTSGRPDDKDEVLINNRISVYKDETLPVAEYYKAQSKFKTIEGVGSIDTIFNSLCGAVDGL